MEDLRVIKTRQAIRSAFISLMNEKGFAHITVQDILERALINRKTFYKYYRDKYDLAETLGREFLALFDRITAERFSENGKLTISAIDEIYSELKSRKAEVNAIWKIRTDNLDVHSELEKRLKSIYMKLAEKYSTGGDIAFQAMLFSTYVLSSYEFILETDQNFESHKLLTEYEHLCSVIERTSKLESC